MRRLRSLRRQLGRDVTARLVSALVLSRLDYCNAILVGLPQTTLKFVAACPPCSSTNGPQPATV